MPKHTFSDRAASADWAMIYFAGHGMEIAGTNYLIPVDARLRADRDVPDEAVSLNRVLDSLGLACKLRLVVLDACRDNPYSTGMTRSAGFSTTRGLAPPKPGPALVVYAAAQGQVAFEGDGANSPFVTALTKYMATPGLELRRLFDQVAEDVLQATENKQEPVTYGRLPPGPELFFSARR